MKYEKIAPTLMVAVQDYEEEGRAGLTRHMRTLGLVSREGSPKPARAVVFIHCDPQANLEHLADYNVRINQPSGRVRTAFLPVESLDPLSEDPAIQGIVPSRYMRLLMDVAPAKVNLPIFRSLSGLSGQGVIVGVVDSGIDPKHPAFKGRISRIWDQVLPGPGVAEGDYGVELSGPLLAVSRDTDGHGTHVAGIAAGSDTRFGGVAPGAELVLVKTDLQDAHIADGIRYIFRLAGELGRPAVVNLSLGGHLDAHDGSDSLSQIIDGETGPGRIVCCAAGNEGNDDIHAQTTLRQGRRRSMRFRVPASAGGDAIRMVGLNGWYSGRDQIEVAVRSPGGFQTPYQGVITAGSPGRTCQLPDGRVRIFTPGPDLSNGDHNFLVEISHPSDTRQPVAAGNWRLWLRGAAIQDGRVDVWVLDSSPGLDVVFSGSTVSDSHKIGSPGAAASAITVAAYTTKVRWTDVQGHIQEVGLELNDISDFSSEGPLRTGSQKPDVAAPGAMIVAPLSADSLVSAHDMASPGYRMMAGTSMATPFITGIVALLLEREPTLNPAQVKALLRADSRVPGKPAGTFDPKWGYGLVNLARIGGTFRSQAEAKAGGRIGVEAGGDWVVIGGVRLPVRRG
jgi:subtilisin family serine protease